LNLIICQFRELADKGCELGTQRTVTDNCSNKMTDLVIEIPTDTFIPVNY